MATANQTPEQRARDGIDSLLEKAGWIVQDRNNHDFNAGSGIALREYRTDIGGRIDYTLFINKDPIGVIEAKPEDWGHKITVAEEQSARYAHSSLQYIKNNEPLRFVYESTNILIRFTDLNDPKPRSREIFNFPRPKTIQEWLSNSESLRKRLQKMPALSDEDLRVCQFNAIERLERSFKENNPRALIQMATGAGKTYTAVRSAYRLLKYADAKRILFLVDTRSLGEQAEQEFRAHPPVDGNHKFIDLYTVHRLTSSHVPRSHVCISTIQRLYSILKGEPLDEADEETNPNEQPMARNGPKPVVYNPRVPPEFFDFIIIDECHRSIYNVWRQVLEYFDAFLIGLTATPDNRTYGFFRKNVVNEYTHEQAVADGVNVGYEIYMIETERTKTGGTIKAGQYVEKRERLTRKKRWEWRDEDEIYSGAQLDRSVVNHDQIRTVISTFKEKQEEIFPGRNKEVPKTLIFAKTDSHADDIIKIVREVFAEGNEFCKKLTYKADNPQSVLNQFRNDYNPRIAVTVDMIATGIDVKPLECLLFMRDVKSRVYFEQMKGRGTRVMDYDALKRVSLSAASAKTHYVIVDAVGVTKSLKTASEPLITRPGISFQELARSVAFGVWEADIVRTLAGRLARLNKQLNEKEQKKITEKSKGVSLTKIVSNLLLAIDPDQIDARAREMSGVAPTEEPPEDICQKAQKALVKEAAVVLTGELIELLSAIRGNKEQTIDHENLDSLIQAGWDGNDKENAPTLIQEFQSYLEANRDKIEALTIFYSQPFRRREVTYDMIQQVMEQLRSDRPNLAPVHVWRAYAQLENYKGQTPPKELEALVALIRRVCGIDKSICAYRETVHRNFQAWIMKRHEGNRQKFTKEQIEWLHMIREHIISSFHMERNDLDKTPFDAVGGMGKMYQLFGEKMDSLIDEINEALAA